MMWFGYVIVMF